MGASRELVLSVVDNGDSIPSTIFQRYQADRSEMVASDYARAVLDVSEIGRITITRPNRALRAKLEKLSQKAGMGLTYIKEDTRDIFRGRLTIISDGARANAFGHAAEPLSGWGAVILKRPNFKGG